MSSAPLARRLGLGDAVVVGVSAMIGAGVFAVFTPAAQAAGAWLLAGLAIAAVVAFCNATSTAQLAATFPTSGGTYVYGREQLGPWWGFAAGWCFVVGKTASCAAMATTFAVYAVPGPWQRPVAAAVVLALTAVSLRGVTRTAGLARMILTVVLAALLVALAAAWLGGGRPVRPSETLLTAAEPVSAFDVLQAAGLIFFALAGYARVATLGEEVRDPGRTIPRAILTALLAVTALYAVVAITLLQVLGPDGLATSRAPVADAVAAGTWSWAGPVVRVGAAAACLGALLAMLAGVGRTTLAMARERDLPGALAAVHPTYHVPHRAELAVGLVVVVAVLIADLREIIGFSSVGVLLYYAVANVSALTQQPPHRRFPRWLQVLGATGCVALVAALPTVSLVAGLAVLAVGLLVRVVALRRRRRTP